MVSVELPLSYSLGLVQDTQSCRLVYLLTPLLVEEGKLIRGGVGSKISKVSADTHQPHRMATILIRGNIIN